MNQFKYDVAFSFLAKDEILATQLNDRLQDRVTTFLYSKKQEQIAGTDGEKTFNKVFGEEARIVVLLYRDGWGQTPFTRIEETAIKNRSFNHGYDFLLCIPLDEPPVAPEWYPKTNLWLGLSRWGVGEETVQELCASSVLKECRDGIKGKQGDCEPSKQFKSALCASSVLKNLQMNGRDF